MRFLFSFSLAFFCGSILAATPEHKTLTQAIKRIAPHATVDSIKPSAMPGVLEVILSGEVLYISTDGQYLLQGRIFDTQKRKDLTAVSENKLRVAALKKVGADQRLSFKADTPKHQVTIITDVDCGYCRQMHQQMADYNHAGISVDYLFLPRSGLNTPSFDKATFIWCAADQKQAMNESMSVAGKVITEKAQCPNPIASYFEIVRKLAVTGTPTVIAENGALLGGYLTPEGMKQRLDALATR